MPSHIWDGPSPEVAALPRASAEYLADLNRRLRQAFLSGIEELSWHERGRGLTEEEVRDALRDYPGDLPDLRGESTD